MAVIALGWAIAIACAVPSWVPLEHLVSTAPMRGDSIEMEREIGGLAIVFSWMAALAISARGRVGGGARL